MTTRTDQYSPKNIDPALFEYQESIDTHPPVFTSSVDSDKPGYKAAVESYNEVLRRHAEVCMAIENQLDRAADHREIGRCGHCGAYLRYAFIFRNVNTGLFLVVGQDCADNTMEVPDRASLDIKRLKDRAAAERKRQARDEEVRTRRDQAERDYPEAVALMRQIVEDMPPNYRDILVMPDAPNYLVDRLPFLENVTVRFYQLGYLFKGQADALVRVAESRRQKADALPVPEGKGVVVEGVVIKIDEKETQYGCRFVMTVKSDDGWAVWGTNPIGVEKGDRVRFTAELQRSDRDETFGFFKRPRKASVVV